MFTLDRLFKELVPGEILGVQVGLSRTAVLARTANGIQCGLAATLTDAEMDHHARPSVMRAGHLHQLNCLELAALAQSDSQTEVSVGLAAINALLPGYPEHWMELNAEKYLLQSGVGKNIAVIGHFPFVQALRRVAQNVWVLELHPREGDLPADAAPEIIPRADVIVITATTLINKTFNGLMELRRSGAEVVLLGPSTPLSPVLYDYGVNVLSGTVVVKPEDTLRYIGQGAGLRQLQAAGCVQLVMTKRNLINGK
jgi:uncharacterized protein (DUF4213/DUF364 family)